MIHATDKDSHQEYQPIQAGTLARIAAFNQVRSWDQFHNPKDLAISISLEAAELLECFQWSGKDLDAADKLDHMLEETADVLIYALLLCQKLGVDPDTIINRKLDQNGRKYPVDQAAGSARKHTELDRD
ncbi:MAG: nucleotide pyrophosphohydrolase [Eubacteriales bacterium]|nr:nucleotide pyrophosphohydrolase [Eubacteriales bacterium]